MAWIVKSFLKSISTSDFWGIVWGWFIGIVTGLTIPTIALAFIMGFRDPESDVPLFVATVISGLMAGGIGSGIMYRVIDRELAREHN